MGELRVVRQVIASERWKEEEDGEHRMMASFIFRSANKYYSVNCMKKTEADKTCSTHERDWKHVGRYNLIEGTSQLA
jgi:hypothetical protein